jgi:presenilin-like A22 family membrane protease
MDDPTANKTTADAAPLPRGAFWFAGLVETAVFLMVFGLVLLAEGRGRATVMVPIGSGEMVWSFLAAFAAATALLILLLRSRRGPHWFSRLFSLAVFIGSGIIAERFFGLAGAVLGVSLAVLAHYGLRRVVIFDLVLTLGLAGITLNLGSVMQPLSAVVILAILSFYDIFAVFVTGHMVTAAETLLRQKALFAIIVPVAPAGLLKRLKAVTPGADFLILGTGDIVLPGLLVAAVGRLGILQALPVALGALTGLAAMHFIFTTQPQRRPIPALPPIALGSILGYLVTFIVPV